MPHGTMTAFRRPGATYRWRLIALIACALLVRALVPTGWMPLADAHGLRIVPCAGRAPVVSVPHHAMAEMKHERGSDHSGSGADHPCAFAGLAAAVDLPDVAAPSPATPVRRAAPLVRMDGAVGHGLAAPPPPQTGPPLT